MISVRPFRDGDLQQLVSAWSQALPLDALTEDIFVNRVLLDENLQPGGLLVAEAEGVVAGFALCLTLRHPIEKVGLMEHRGFITAFGVAPDFQRRGIGSMLLAEAEIFFREWGRRDIAIAPYAPNYFVPGVDRVAYAGGLAWLQRHGFTEFSEGIAMDAPIGTFSLSAETIEKERTLAAEGLIVCPLGRDRVAAFMEFMSATMPGDWVEDARRLLRSVASGAAPRDSVYIAVDGDKIVGYCEFEGEHFGPFGVAESHQGRGAGSILLSRTLLQMRLEGHHAAYVLWTGERAAQGVYKRLGFTVSRRFAILKKSFA